MVLQYPCAPNCFPTQIREVAAAVELIHSNYAQWHCDPNRVAIMGFSAGDHLGSFVNTSGHKELTEEDVAKFSLEKHISEKTPPAFLWHTTEDVGVPVMNSLLYAQDLAEHKIPFALHIYPYGPHGLATVDEQTNNNLEDKVLLANRDRKSVV